MRTVSGGLHSQSPPAHDTQGDNQQRGCSQQGAGPAPIDEEMACTTEPAGADGQTRTNAQLSMAVEGSSDETIAGGFLLLILRPIG